MNVLVVGGGGREHALVWKLAQSPKLRRLWCAPGNAGIGLEKLPDGTGVECVAIGADDVPSLLAWAKANRPDLTVVGPDNPLALGIVDQFEAEGLNIWGPNKSAARFESSKAFSQAFMEKYGIPTARAGVFVDAAAARVFAAELGGQCAVKADGLALGKGVVICHRVEEAEAAINEMMVGRAFGDAGARIVIQELLEGPEVSLHALCDGKSAQLFPTSQDHKRALDGDRGLNTGGMGTYSPTHYLSDSELAETGHRILEPWLRGCAAEGIVFKGILYPGVMLTRTGPKVLEFNARFGDPETQVYLMRLENDLLEVLMACVEGTLADHPLRFRPEAAVCVVMASGGYPGGYAKGRVIEGLAEAAALPGVKVFHAGTATDASGRIVTSGGRVLGVTALGPTLREAQALAYQAVSMIHFGDAQYRTDIAAKALA